MKGDFTRNTYKERNHYSRVLMQQGRVQLDADWNEQLDIAAHVDRTVRRDVIGHCGGPQGSDADGNPLAGFLITPDGGDVRISAGRYYVGGILAENETERLFTDQVDYREAALPADPGSYLFYLDVWERHLTALDDGDIREVALGGPDTTTRARVMAQVKWEAIEDGAGCQDFGPGWIPDGMERTGRLAARSEPDPSSTDPCIVPEAAGYRRLENQLYRVEVHESGGLGSATFKWSRENGSIVTRWLSQDGDNLTVSSAGRDSVLGFASQEWVELTDEIREQAGLPGTLVMIDNIDGNILTIDPGTATGSTNLVDFDSGTARIRRWESDGLLNVSVPGENDGWIGLEEGVEIKFQTGQFQTGDYWLIPARTLLGDVLWDVEAGTGPEGFQLAHGIKHSYCPLAIGPFSGETWEVLVDCRRLFPPLTEIDRGESCCQVSVGDGVISVGDFSDIQAAVDSLEGSGQICILSGVYTLRQPVLLEGVDVIINGCGRSTVILAPSGEPAFIITGGEVRLESLSIQAASQSGALVARRVESLTVRDCRILNAGIQFDPTHRRRFFTASGMDAPEAARLHARMPGELPLEGMGPAIAVALGRRVAIEQNLLAGLPSILSQAVNVDIRSNRIAAGGVWIADGSAGVKMLGNTISQGEGPGVILGGILGELNLPDREAGVVSVYIDDNTITLMRGSGISSTAEQERNFELGELEDVHIRGNRIRHCALNGPDQRYDPVAAGGIVLRHISGLYIRDNLITHNGGEGAPACGVFTYACLGLEVVNNHISDNGDPAIRGENETCVRFSEMEPQEGPGPFESEIASFASVDFNNQPTGFLIDSIAGTRGLNCHFGTEISLTNPAAGVRMNIVVGNRVILRAIRADGSEEEQILSSQAQPQDVGFSGPDIVRVRVQAPGNESWIVNFCVLGEGVQVEGYQAGLAALYVIGGEVSDPSLSPGVTFQTSSPAALIHDNVIVCPRGQALIVGGVGPVSISDNTLTSQGARQQPPTSQNDLFSRLAALGLGVFVYNLGQMPGAGGAAGGVSTAGELNFTSVGSLRASAPVRTTLPDGRTLFHGNQVTLEILDEDDRLLTSCAALISLDDLSIQDNQVLTRIASPVITSVFAHALTIRASGNRMHELPNRALASYFSQGIMNNATGNQGTHCIIVNGTMVVNSNNQVAIPDNCQAFSNLNTGPDELRTVGIGRLSINREAVLRRVRT
jgi:hypothetical protein